MYTHNSLLRFCLYTSRKINTKHRPPPLTPPLAPTQLYYQSSIMNVRHLKHTLLVNLDNMKNEPRKGGGGGREDRVLTLTISEHAGCVRLDV